MRSCRGSEGHSCYQAGSYKALECRMTRRAVRRLIRSDGGSVIPVCSTARRSSVGLCDDGASTMSGIAFNPNFLLYRPRKIAGLPIESGDFLLFPYLFPSFADDRALGADLQSRRLVHRDRTSTFARYGSMASAAASPNSARSFSVVSRRVV